MSVMHMIFRHLGHEFFRGMYGLKYSSICCGIEDNRKRAGFEKQAFRFEVIHHARFAVVLVSWLLNESWFGCGCGSSTIERGG